MTRGHIINPHGWSQRIVSYKRGLVMRWRHTPIYRVSLDADAPLTYQDGNGEFWQPNRSFETDLGSIPSLVEAFLPRAECIAYLFHDSAYDDRGLWRGDTQDGPFYFQPLNRTEADAMLREIMLAQWGDPVKAGLVYAAVRAGGWRAWSQRTPKIRPEPVRAGCDYD